MYMFNQPLFFPAVHCCSILCSYQFVTSPLKLAAKNECEVFDWEGMKNWTGHRCATEEANITNWYNIDGLKLAWVTVKLTPMK